MFSKFKVKSVGGGNFVIHFQHNRAQSCAPAQIQPSLTEVYEAETRRLREENHHLRIQHNSIITQLNEVLGQLQQANTERTLLKQRTAETENVFYNTKKGFFSFTLRKWKRDSFKTNTASATDAFVLRLNENDHIGPFSIQRLSRAIFPVQSASIHTQSLFYSFFSYE